MSLWRRFLYAGAFVAVLNAIVLLGLATMAPDVLSAFLKEMQWFVFVELAFAMPFAPSLSRHLPRKRGET